MNKAKINYTKIETMIGTTISPIGKDPHVTRAIEMFGVPEEEVTHKMREIAKLDNYVRMYSHPFGKSK